MYKDIAEAFPRGGCREIGNHETEADPAKIRGGNAVRFAPGRVSHHSNNTNTATMMKME
jgi:hypothetical protein